MVTKQMSQIGEYQSRIQYARRHFIRYTNRASYWSVVCYKMTPSDDVCLSTQYVRCSAGRLKTDRRFMARGIGVNEHMCQIV